MKKIFKFLIIGFLIISLAILNTPSPSIYKSNYIEFYDINGDLIQTEIKGKVGKYVYLDELNQYTIDAFISYEDKNFYKHKGFDLLRIIKSLFINISNKEFTSGASTITQQYARILFLNNKKTLTRKIKEAYYTIKLESKYSKDEILEGYLNNIYLGHGCYGIESASLYYFNKSSKDLTLEESALLATLPSSPNNGSPINNYNKAMIRKNKVLEIMLEEKYISESEYKTSKNKTINISDSIINKSNINYYLDHVKQELLTMNLSLNKGLKVYTNIDITLYNKINNISNKYKNNDNELSLIILENHSNKVLANLGGYEYAKSEYNRSIKSSRQIGSTIKTFLYAFALENNINTSTLLKSEKTTFNIKGYGTYSPSNPNNIYANKKINMEEAFAVSDNIYATKILLLLGSENFVSYLKKFNLYSNDNVPSIALGTCEFTLFDLVKAYSVIANDGYYNNYSFINKISDSYNNVLYQQGNSSILTINKYVTNSLKHLLSLPFKKGNYYTKSTMESYMMEGWYGKTGSTQNDSYVIASNDKYTIAIKVGTDDISNKLYDYTTSKNILKDISNII